MHASTFKPANLENKSVQRILGAALHLWARDGYHGASLKDVAAEAGVAKSLLHYHFESKEHLLIELQADWCRKVALAVRGRLATGTPSLATAFAAFDQVWDAMVATRAQFPFAIEVWRESCRNPAIRARLVEFDHEIMSLVEVGLVQSLGPLTARLRLPADRMAALLHAMLDGVSLRLFLDDDVVAVRRIFDDFKALFAAAMDPAPPSGGPS